MACFKITQLNATKNQSNNNNDKKKSNKKRRDYGKFLILFMYCILSSDPAKNDSLKLKQNLHVVLIKLLQCLILDWCSAQMV